MLKSVNTSNISKNKTVTGRGQFYLYCKHFVIRHVRKLKESVFQELFFFFFFYLKSKLLLLLFASKNVWAEDIFKFIKFNTFTSIYIRSRPGDVKWLRIELDALFKTTLLLPILCQNTQKQWMTSFHNLRSFLWVNLRLSSIPGPCCNSSAFFLPKI